MIGKCLCGEVSFELSGELPAIYQCHCSLCRQVSGSSSNSALIISADNFKWISGQSNIKSYATESGFKSEFCQHCGSPVPNISKNGESYWIPVGLMSEPIATVVKAHVYTGSRASWDEAFLKDKVPKFVEMPSESEWLEFLKLGSQHFDCKSD